MGFFSDRKIKKAEENMDLDELLSLSKDNAPDTAAKAREAFVRVAGAVSKRSLLATEELRKLANQGQGDLRVQAWRALLRGGDPQYLEDVGQCLTADPNGLVTKLAMGYFDDVRERDPEMLRSRLTANESITALIVQDLTADKLTLKDPRVQRAYRFVELFGLWDQADIAEKTMALLESNTMADNPKLHALLLDAMTRAFPERMAKFLLNQWLKNTAVPGCSEQMVERIKGVGKQAIPLLMNFITDYRSKIETQRSAQSVRTPEYEVSRWAVYLLGELALKDDPKVIDFLIEMSVDTKLSDTGHHRKNAREALEKIRSRVA